MESLDLQELLAYRLKKTIRFSEFIEGVMDSPLDYLHTSSSLISDAIKYFGFEIVIRSGQPIISYNIFKDLFSTGVNAVFGQEHCIKHIVNVIESFDNEAGLNRGIVLVGPPASGKTNIVDLIIRALEEYTKQKEVKLYTFFFKFPDPDGSFIEIRSKFNHNPLLLFPISMPAENGSMTQPRKVLFDHIKENQINPAELIIPNFFHNATLDKRTLDILEVLQLNPINKNKSLYDVLEQYIRVEEIEFTTAQAKGISNIDETSQLRTRVNPVQLDAKNAAIINEHLPGKFLYQYDGAIVDSNRGILHIHDAFGIEDGSSGRDYKPLLMLLGSGKVSVESTQASVDNSVIITANIEEMKHLEEQLDSSKLLDRIERVPVNYLLDSNSEMDILKRDMTNMREEYDVDPNLLRIAAYYSVLTRLLPPMRKRLPENWSEEKKKLYNEITPEQKLHIYSAQNEDPVRTIQELPYYHSFHNEMIRLGLNSYDIGSFSSFIASHPKAVNLRDCNLFTNEELKLVDNEFMRDLWNEHFPIEGKSGLSVRQLQNIMRNTITHSDGRKVHVGIFLKQLASIIEEGPELHHWLATVADYKKKKPIFPYLNPDQIQADASLGTYGDFKGLIEVVRKLYHSIVNREITVCTVDRNPEQIEFDLRKYIQHTLLNSAVNNKAFAHVMIPKFSFVDPQSGQKVDRPDEDYMKTIETILEPERDVHQTREEMAEKFLDLQSSGEIVLEAEKTVITSKHDNLLQCFAREFSVMLSHRKVDDEINPEQLGSALFHKKNDPERLSQYSTKVRNFMTNILSNLNRNFDYSPQMALDTVIFALRYDIVKFEDILR